MSDLIDLFDGYTLPVLLAAMVLISTLAVWVGLKVVPCRRPRQLNRSQQECAELERLYRA